MGRKLASIVRIASCDPIPDTDSLSVATMDGKGWRVVTGRDEFKTGDIAVYFEIDAYLPTDDDRFKFLEGRCLRKFMSKSGNLLAQGYRIKTVKLRGVLSQGLLMPITAFGEIESQEIGLDVTEALKVKHYDEIVEAFKPVANNAVNADAMGPFPSWIQKTDEERIQNLGDYFTTMKGRAFEVTEKNDGSSVTMFYAPSMDPENPFGVCSRNIRLKEFKKNGEKAMQWQMADKYKVQDGIRAAEAVFGEELAFQGELVGPAVNGNRDLYQDWEWHVFKVYSITRGKYLIPEHARRAVEIAGFTYVPVISESMNVFDEITNMDDLLKFAEGKTAHGNEREGLVFKSTLEPYVTFKAVSNAYLLKIGKKD